MDLYRVEFHGKRGEKNSGIEYHEMEEKIMGMNSRVQIPLEIQVLNRRAMVMSGYGSSVEALKLFSCVVYIAPRFARAQYETGRCLDHPGRHNEAVERYDKAMRLDPAIVQVRSMTDTSGKADRWNDKY
jgi:tetratricopeptide (TPR) repeat protein